MTKWLGIDGRVRDDSLPGTGGYPYMPVSSNVTSTGFMLLTQTAAVASVATLTTPNDVFKHLYRISVVVIINTANAAGSINAEVTYTDTAANARTLIIPLTNTAGTVSAAVIGPVADAFVGTFVIGCNPNTAVTILTAGTFTGVTYSVGGSIEQIR